MPRVGGTAFWHVKLSGHGSTPKASIALLAIRATILSLLQSNRSAPSPVMVME